MLAPMMVERLQHQTALELTHQICAHLFPVKWNSLTTAEGDIAWTAGKEEAYATLDGGKSNEVRLKKFKGTGGEAVVIRNLPYWGVKRHEGFAHCTQLRRYLLEHPLLVLELGFRPVLDVSQPYGFDVKRTVPSDRWFREQQRSLSSSMLQDLLAATVDALREEIPGLGEVVAFDVTHIYAFVKENNLRVYVKDRYKKEVQPTGDPD